MMMLEQILKNFLYTRVMKNAGGRTVTALFENNIDMLKSISVIIEGEYPETAGKVDIYGYLIRSATDIPIFI